MLCCTALSPMELLQQVAWKALRELAAAGKALLLPLQRSPSAVGTSLLQACDKAHRITQLMQPLCMALEAPQRLVVRRRHHKVPRSSAIWQQTSSCAALLALNCIATSARFM